MKNDLELQLPKALCFHRFFKIRHRTTRFLRLKLHWIRISCIENKETVNRSMSLEITALSYLWGTMLAGVLDRKLPKHSDAVPSFTADLIPRLESPPELKSNRLWRPCFLTRHFCLNSSWTGDGKSECLRPAPSWGRTWSDSSARIRCSFSLSHPNLGTFLAARW